MKCFRILATSLCLTLPSVLSAANPFDMDTYTQEVTITFKTKEAAQAARVEMLPLYHGYDQAFSSRWDDNHLDDLHVQAIMARYDVKGTFFLNDSHGWHQPSETGYTLDGDPQAVFAKHLLAGDNSIGAPSLNHEFVPFPS